MKKDDAKNIILDLCGGTGAWSKPYADNGFDVRVITLPDHSVSWNTFHEESMLFLKNIVLAENIEIKYSDVYGVLAAPPCTEFSQAKNGHHRGRDFISGMEPVRACMEIIWHIQERANLKFWALENPRGLLRRFLGKPKYTFEQWQFGGYLYQPLRKCLWT
jgi:site-specific DNA-cytosine methylase